MFVIEIPDNATAVSCPTKGKGFSYLDTRDAIVELSTAEQNQSKRRSKTLPL